MSVDIERVSFLSWMSMFHLNVGFEMENHGRIPLIGDVEAVLANESGSLEQWHRTPTPPPLKRVGE